MMDQLHMPQKLESIMGVLKIPQIQSEKWFFDMLLDCTYYEHTELRNAAMGLLIRHFEQKVVLARWVPSTQALPAFMALAAPLLCTFLRLPYRHSTPLTPFLQTTNPLSLLSAT